MQQSNFPVILFDIENNVLPIDCVSKSNNFLIRSYQIFSVEIVENISSNNLIYSVHQNPVPLTPEDLYIINSNKMFVNDNFSYTIYIETDCVIRVIGLDNVQRIYNISLQLDNVLTLSQEHYNDLLINNNLPTFIELEPAIISGDKADMIKRLLLDFKNIINKKGTTIGITRFLNLIGFDPESINVYEEYKTPSNQLTINPNKLVDIKTGYYHVLYNNWIINPSNPLTLKNLPNRLINISNLDEFFEKLWYAIILANKYFTLPEQDISFFGLTNSVNQEKYLSIAGNMTILNKADIHLFRKNIGIDLYTNESTQNIDKRYIVKNRLQINNVCYNTEIKYLNQTQTLNDELFLIDLEILDDVIYNLLPEDELKIQSTFGNILNLILKSPNTYCEYVIENIGNEFTKIKSDKFWLDELDVLHLKFVSSNNSLNNKYRVTVYFYDIHNNREVYTYEYTISNNIAKIDFEIYNSTNLYETEIDNKLTTDIESSWLMTEINPENFILPNIDVPNLLDTYFTVTSNNPEYVYSNKRLVLNDMHTNINPNFIIDNSTDSIPVDFMDNYIHIISIPYLPNRSLKLRCVNDLTQEIELLDYFDEQAYTSTPDKLFITIMDILNTDTNVSEPYIYISTTEVGIDIVKNLYDLVFIDDNDEIISIYDVDDIQEKKEILSFDVSLFFRESELVTGFINHPSYVPIMDEINIHSDYPKIKTIYQRLINIGNNINTYQVKLGDIIMCRANPNYITNHKNIIWSVYNSFTNELLYKSNDYMLKFRVNDETIYTIDLSFIIENKVYSITKKSIQSSFI